jgi:hypothetical protein
MIWNEFQETWRNEEKKHNKKKNTWKKIGHLYEILRKQESRESSKYCIKASTIFTGV